MSSSHLTYCYFLFKLLFSLLLLFFFNDTATTEIYTLSLHDALPISPALPRGEPRLSRRLRQAPPPRRRRGAARSEEHTSELQSRLHLVCRLLLEKKKQQIIHQELRRLALVRLEQQ